ncbi:MAG: sulfatase-like hydrolase/transferase, partial [Armatimonadota bacterium]
EANGRDPYPEFDGPIEKWDDARGKPPSGLVHNRAARYWHPQISLNGKHFRTTADDYGPDIFVDFLIDFAKRKRNEPFFIYYPMALTHRSWDFDRNVSGWLPTPKLDAQGNRVPGRSEPGLKSNVEYKDYLMGRIARELTELGLMDDTILFITADNGTSGYGKGQVAEERGPRVPLVAYGPGHVQAIGPSDTLVNHCDIFATMRDLSGASLPEAYPIDGHSFAPLLSGRPFEEREWIFSYYKFQRMLRDKRWLLDGYGRLFDCGNRRDEQGYRDVTDSTAPEVVAARKRFESLLADLPAPDPTDPIVVAYHKKRGESEGSPMAIIPEVTTLAVGPEPVRIECRHFVTLETDATVSLSHAENSLLVAFDVQNEDAASLRRKSTEWGECDGLELSIYGGGLVNLVLRAYPDGSVEAHKNVGGELQPLSLPVGHVNVQTSLTATGWAAQIRLTPDLFGGALPKTMKFNAGGYRTGTRTGWFAWINKGRENFRPKNQGTIELR